MSLQHSSLFVMLTSLVSQSPPFGGGRLFVAGLYDSLVVEHGGNFANVHFSNGTQCASGEARRTTIAGTCDQAVFGLLVDSITEPSVCRYLISVRSNLFCSPGGSCSYAADSLTYDLSKVPILSKTVSGQFQYSLALCNNGSNTRSCGGISSLICQKDLTANVEFSVGSSQSIVSSSTYEAVLQFVNGSRCASGKQREATVHLLCAQRNEIINVTENPTCVYDVFVATEAACPLMSHRPLRKPKLVKGSNVVLK